MVMNFLATLQIEKEKNLSVGELKNVLSGEKKSAPHHMTKKDMLGV